MGVKKQARTIMIANHKGGVGKTTTAVNLAAALCGGGPSTKARRQVCLIDLDGQASASTGYRVRTESGLERAAVGSITLEECLMKTEVDGLSLVPSPGFRLVEAVERNADFLSRNTGILARQIAALDHFNFIVIDCGPSLGPLVYQAYAAAGEVLIPVTPSAPAVVGLAQCLDVLDVVREGLNPEIKTLGILVCRADARTRHTRDVIEHLRETHGSLVLKTVIRQNVRIEEAFLHGQPITQYDPNSAGAEDYRALADEILRRR